DDQRVLPGPRPRSVESANRVIPGLAVDDIVAHTQRRTQAAERRRLLTSLAVTAAMAPPAAMSSGTPDTIDSATSSRPVCRIGPTTLAKRNPRMAMRRKRAADLPRRIDRLFGRSLTFGVFIFDHLRHRQRSKPFGLCFEATPRSRACS